MSLLYVRQVLYKNIPEIGFIGLPLCSVTFVKSEKSVEFDVGGRFVAEL